MHGRSRRRRPGSSSHDAESPSPSPSITIAMIDAAVVKAHSDHLAAGESISAWRVSQSALVTLKADSFESLGLRMQNVPSLYRIMVTEAKVNSFIHCFVAVQKITSLYDLELAICESEGIKGFEELELGPLLKHPLVAHYFSAGCDVTEMFKITSEQVISYLNILLYKKKKITVDDLLDYIAKRTDQSRENLCIRIQSLGMHIGHIMRGRRSEFTLLKKCSDGLNVKLDHDDNEGDIAEDEDNDKNDDARICLDTKMDYSFTSQDGKRCNHQVALSEGPGMKHTVHKTPRQMPDGRLIKRGSRADNVETGFIDNNEVDGHTWMFIRIWREMCKTENVVEAFDQMLDFYKGKMSTKKKDKALKSMLSSYPQFGLLNVAIASIKFGMWDCISNAPQAKTCAVDANIEVETAKKGILGAGKHVLESCVDKNDDARDCGIFSSETATSSEPSAAAQVPRILLDTEVDYGFTSSHDCKSHHDHVAPSQGKQDKGCTKQIHKRPRVTPFGRLINSGFLADNTETGFIDNHEIYGHMRIFIKIWTEICKTKNVAEAFDLMLDFYNGQMTEKKKNKALRSMLSSYPEFGLLNVAIASIKFGMWDHISIAPQANSKEVLANTIFKTHTVDVNTEDEPAEKDVPAPDVALEDILKNISAYFEFSKHVPDNINAYPKIQSIFLREFCKLEHWLTGQFSINDFEALGFGEFFTFLEEHVSLLPTAWQDCFLTIDKNEKPSVKVCMNQYYLHEFLSQAVNSLNEHETLSESMVSELLQIQYPFAGLELVKDDFTTNLLTNVSKNRNLSSNILLFSSTLSNFRSEKHLLDTCVGTKDAIELLLKAPMLVDLTLWSYWDHRFAPSLGPILGWLVSEVTSKELLCLVTRDGKVLRIDHSATVDSFLEAFLHRSSFQTAVQLLSLLALYGGERNVPLSLLKCHAKSAFEVMLKISSDTKVNNNQRFLATGVNKSAVPSASRFLLDCLGYLPNEFRSFAADLLISAFRSIIKDAHLVILHECKHKDDHLMLHELGLLLGIVEWFDDYCTCRLSESEESFEHTSKRFSLKDVVIPSLEVKLPSDDCKRDSVIMHSVQSAEIANNAANIIESIRREEFGVDPNLSVTESSVLKKQHERLGRALHCLSQELYSQDSHFLLELVQNADDNVYSRNVEPTLTFILQEKSIVVLNNEHGFSAENIRALCDVGNSTKKASSAGYIGKKGIGFKSVFRVTDAPEIHSNGFHIKFDLSEGQIGFVLPTIVPPCDVNLFTNLVPVDPTDQVNKCHWNTCIVLPFKSKLTESIVSMFSDLHPSLLLFLHRLQCIKFRNTLDDSFVIMRKEIVGNGLVNVSNGNEILTWFVESRELQANIVRDDVKTTEISIAFALELSGHDNYIPKLDQQYVFAFLPLRTYGLKFIIQGDFILPSSREEVDGDSSWNQWLLTEFPSLFVSSEKLFCCLPGFRDSLGKGISVFLSYVPLVGEVHGFFANLPRMIISKLCMSNCLLLEGDNTKWVPPCRVLRNWNEKVRDLLPDSLIHKHLGLGYLNKDIVLSDSLAKALGIESYGPKILVRILSSLCRTKGLPSMGLGWLSSWLNALYEMSGQSSVDYDIMNTLKKTPFIPLLDGCYGSIEEGMIWMDLDTLCMTDFSKIFNKLRIVNPALLDCSITENLTRMLYKVGVQRLSAHEVVKSHVLPAISDKMNTITSKDLMTEYLSFIMVHVQSSCPDCSVEREHIISEVYNKAFILTNHGFIRPVETAIHFDNDFGNDIDMGRLINDMDIKWFEVDKTYLKYGDMLNWRKFLQELRVTDFVQTVRVEKTGSNIVDWESEELACLLLSVSSSGDLEKCKLLLEVLDAIWDDYFGDKVVALSKIDGENKPFKSALVSTLNAVRWVASSVDDRLYYPKDLFNDCEAVCSILGDNAPYAVPKVRSKKLVTSIGFKTAVTIDDALSVLEVWKRSGTSFNASISQMSRFYSFIWNELASSNQKNTENLLSGAFIFVPFSSTSSSEVVPGVLLSPQEVYWHDRTISPQCEFSKILSNLYPSLHGFFVNECGVKENPPLLSYIESLRHLSKVDTPSKAAKRVFDVFVMWSDGLDSGQLSFDDVQVLKKSLEEKETRVLPTAHDMWVSLHPSFGLVCWCDDKKLANEFEELNNIDFLHLCELDDQEKVMLRVKVSVLMQRLGIPALSEVVTREAIYYGLVDNSFETSLVSWALPYAQRYISNAYRERYLQLKLSGFEKLNRLQIVVVEKLFYKNIIKRSKLASKKRHDSSCLLQEEILYVRRELDPHSIFMELSRFLVNGNPELHLANFLHMITTMTESGSTEEQIETFISNNQKVPKLLDNEPVWSIQVQPIALTASATTSISKRLIEPMPNTSNSGRKSRSNSNWPPVNWKTAPRFVNDLNMQDITKQIDFNTYSIEEHPQHLEHSRSSNDNVLEHDLVDQDGAPRFSQRDQLSHGSVNVQQAVLTGRLGEEVAFNYYTGKFGFKFVKWVNEDNETGLPYDIEICDDKNTKEFIEVKTTDSARKDWFEVSVKEWEFAVEKGEYFSIARVVLLGDGTGQVTEFKNPARLCRTGLLKLAVVMAVKKD